MKCPCKAMMRIVSVRRSSHFERNEESSRISQIEKGVGDVDEAKSRHRVLGASDQGLAQERQEPGVLLQVEGIKSLQFEELGEEVSGEDSSGRTLIEEARQEDKICRGVTWWEG
jgi:hypothetical protein